MSLIINIVASSSLSYHGDLLEMKDRIEELVDSTKKFDSVDQCLEFLHSVHHDYILLIVTPELLPEIYLGEIHQIRQVQSIFLFDPEHRTTSDEIVNFHQFSYKMNEVFFSAEILYEHLWKWIRNFSNRADLLLSTLACFPSNSMSTNVVNNIADFAELWYPLYLSFLSDLPIDDPVTERKRFIEQCRIYYARNPGVLRLIDEFERDYTPDRALYYYSSDGFLYRLINRALRRQLIDGITNFRFLLNDIRDQLRNEYRSLTRQTFYRGQRMSPDELNQLNKKSRTGTLITTNSYFSTSLSRSIAQRFAGQSTNKLISVLFIITAQIDGPPQDQRKPFAYIGNVSAFGDAEEEVLFSIGSFFKIERISYDNVESLWIVEMTFIDENDIRFQVTKDFRMLQTGSPEILLIKIGSLLTNHPRQGLTQAKAFYQMIINQNFSSSLNSACRIGLAWLSLREKNIDLAIEHFFQNEENPLSCMRLMVYNGLGHASRLKKQYDQALTYFYKAKELNHSIPIDKYAMYDGYRNIVSMNIASTHLLMNDAENAWDIYKKMLAKEMTDSTHFHGHTYLTIAQTGLHQAHLNNDQLEYERCSANRKAFLNLSLTSMSGNYRRSIISEVLNLGFECAHHPETRTMAIEYFKKIITISQRFVQTNRDDYLIVLQCENHISRLMTQQDNYDEAMHHALNALRMCRENSLNDLVESYESLVFMDEQYLQNVPNEIDSEEILTFDRSEFSFGQFSVNGINPVISIDGNRKRRLTFCLLKIAALLQKLAYQEEKKGELNDDEILIKRSKDHFDQSRKSLSKALDLFGDDLNVRMICLNNFAYLDGQFDSIIDYYREELNQNQLCIGEDCFCYIAHLYLRKGEKSEARHWYQLAIEYFQSHDFICKHTVPCFYSLARHYQKFDQFYLAVEIFENLVNFLLKHQKSLCSLQRSIDGIVKRLVRHFQEKNDLKRVIAILEKFIDLLQLKSTDKESTIDQKFREILDQCHDEKKILIDVYSSYIQIFWNYKSPPSSSYLRIIEPIFHQVLSIYRVHGEMSRTIEIQQNFIKLLLATNVDRSMIGTSFKQLALDIDDLQRFDISLQIYTRWGQFIIEHQNIEDLVSASFVIVRCKLLQVKKTTMSDETRQMLFNLIDFYHNFADPHFVLGDYLKSLKPEINRQSSSGIYLNLLEFCLQHRSELYLRCVKRNIAAMIDRPQQRIEFLKENRVDYTKIITKLVEQHSSNNSTLPIQSKFEFDVLQWINSDGETDFLQLLHCLLEWHSIDDEYLSLAYFQLGQIDQAITLFNPFLYGDIARKFNSKACRRYLKCIYDYCSEEQQHELHHHYSDHFLIRYDPLTNEMIYELLDLFVSRD